MSESKVDLVHDTLQMVTDILTIRRNDRRVYMTDVRQQQGNKQ